jgi:hypothetical protein
MAELKAKKIILSEINGGKQYENGDGIQPDAINAPIQASAYAQALATNIPNTDEAYLVGTPSVQIEEDENGTPRFKFTHLKGFTGAKLVSRVLLGETENGSYIYLDTFDDGTTCEFISPVGRTPDRISDWMGTKQIGSPTKPLYYDGEKFVEYSFPYREKTLEQCTWYEINELSKANKAKDYFYVGEEKTVKFSDGTEAVFVILGFNHDDLSDGTGKAGITFGMRDVYKNHTIRAEAYARGDGIYRGAWHKVYLFDSAYTNNLIYELINIFPSEIMPFVKEVTKKSVYGNIKTGSYNFKGLLDTVNCKLFPFSANEVNLKDVYTFNTGTPYEYYEKISLSLMKRAVGSANYEKWWLRDLIYTIDTNGQVSEVWNKVGDSTVISGSLCIGFCI